MIGMVRVDPKALLDDPGAHLVLGRRKHHAKIAMAILHDILDVRDAQAGLPPRSYYATVLLLDFGNGMHYRDVEALLEGKDGILASTEAVFVETMAVPVIDCFHFTSAADAGRRLLFAAEEGALWRMDDRRADTFYSSYDAGIMHVSEILRAEGLW